MTLFHVRTLALYKACSVQHPLGRMEIRHTAATRFASFTIVTNVPVVFPGQVHL